MTKEVVEKMDSARGGLDYSAFITKLMEENAKLQLLTKELGTLKAVMRENAKLKAQVEMSKTSPEPMGDLMDRKALRPAG